MDVKINRAVPKRPFPRPRSARFSHVAVLVPIFNPGTYLRQCIESLLNQDCDNYRIVLINDASTDGTSTLLENLPPEARIQIIHNPVNVGKAESLNRAFQEIEADFYILQDADDTCRPDRIRQQVEFMLARSNIGCSSSFINYINPNGQQIGRAQLDLLNETKLNEYLASADPFGLFCPAAILRAEVVKDPSLRFRKQFWPADDIDLWNRIAEAGWLVLAQPEYLVNYRIHGTSAVTTSFRSTREKFEFVRTCLRARRADLPEPGWETFKISRANRPVLVKVNDWRKATAKALYRRAGFRWATRDRVLALCIIMAATTLQPIYVIVRLRKQLS